MSAFASWFITIALLAVSGVHLAWSLGSNFPAKDEKTLVRTVAGFPGKETMSPRWSSAAVAAPAFAAALWPLVMSGHALMGLPAWFVSLGGIVLTIVFLGRGIAGFTKWFRNLTPEQPFARLNRLYYSPLCLALGICFLILTLGRFA